LKHWWLFTGEELRKIACPRSLPNGKTETGVMGKRRTQNT